MTAGASPISSASKPTPKVALISLSEPDSTLLRDCFREFHIQAVLLSGIGLERLKTEKFEACVVRLQDETEALLEGLRASPLNKHIVIYGVSDDPEKALPFLKHGINALLEAPLEREAVLETIRATHRLVRHELRCFVRVPLVMEVMVSSGDRSFPATCQEMSAGGMSLKASVSLPVTQKLQLSFTLPNKPKSVLNGVVSWTLPGNRMGVRFDRSSERDSVRRWLEEYLEIT